MGILYFLAFCGIFGVAFRGVAGLGLAIVIGATKRGHTIDRGPSLIARAMTRNNIVYIL